MKSTNQSLQFSFDMKQFIFLFAIAAYFVIMSFVLTGQTAYKSTITHRKPYVYRDITADSALVELRKTRDSILKIKNAETLYVRQKPQ